MIFDFLKKDKDKVRVQEGKRQESHSPLLFGFQTSCKWSSWKKFRANWSSSERVVWLFHLWDTEGAAAWNVDLPHMDLILCFYVKAEGGAKGHLHQKKQGL